MKEGLGGIGLGLELTVLEAPLGQSLGVFLRDHGRVIDNALSLPLMGFNILDYCQQRDQNACAKALFGEARCENSASHEDQGGSRGNAQGPADHILGDRRCVPLFVGRGLAVGNVSFQFKIGNVCTLKFLGGRVLVSLHSAAPGAYTNNTHASY